ncbi:MAG: 6-O-methylguanine DNA methyltransferase [Oscillochloris sp.]|nr:6-O-methylguanine DNA methyltransferase [Oscillochloris sp.]
MSELRDDPVFYGRVHTLVRQIPPGKVSTYGDVAAMVGGGSDGRAVGLAMAALGPDNADVPWQRVISRDGTISTRGLRQSELLEAEGVTFDAQGRVTMARHRWAGPDAAWCAANRYTPLPPRPPEPEQLELF